MNYKFISKTILFRGCSEEEIQRMAEHLDFRTKKYKKDPFITDNWTYNELADRTAKRGLVETDQIPKVIRIEEMLPL